MKGLRTESEIVASSIGAAGKFLIWLARLKVTSPSERTSLMVARVGSWNWSISYKIRIPVWAIDNSPGSGSLPPPIKDPW